MMEHELVPALDPDPRRVASISPAIIQGTLRRELGFQGLVIPDAMDMNALNQIFVAGDFGPEGSAAVEAVKAGEDMVVMPTDLDTTYRALVAAVRSGEIPEAQVDASVTRILEAKASVGLDKARLVDVSALSNLVATPQHVARAQEVADAAVTLVRDSGRVLPLARQGTKNPGLAYGQVTEAGTGVLVIIFTDDLRLDSGHRLEREVRARVPDADVQYVDLRTAAALTPALAGKAALAEKVVVALFIAPTWAKQIRVNGELKNSVSLGDASAALLRALLEKAGEKTAVVSLGSPYVIAGFPGISTYLCTYSSVSSSELSAVKALFGEMPIQGSLPVTIPNVAERGAGIRRPGPSARNMARRYVSP
jgi:beta-N-acetylhexosaminidase